MAPPKFLKGVVVEAWYRQAGHCGHCGKNLSWSRRGRSGEPNSWQPHDRDPNGTDLLRNCVLLCTDGQNCHLNIGHDGDWQSSPMVL